MRKEYTFHSKEEKLEIVKRYLLGESPKALGKELGISDGNIRKWKRQYLSAGESALENRKKPGNPLSKYERRKELTREEQLEYQVELLKRELMKKEAEVVRLKKIHRTERGRYPKKVIQRTYALVQQQAEQYSIVELCKLYKVSRSGYYKWRGRNGQPNCYEKAQKQLDGYVKDIHAHYSSMGYRQIRDTLLLQTGWSVCDLSVWRSMRRLHLFAKANIHHAREMNMISIPMC